MRTRLLSCVFPSVSQPQVWRRLARVLAHTAAVQCPDWDRRIESVGAPSGRRDIGIPSHLDNTHKLVWWAFRFDEAQDGDRVMLIDADTAILRPLDDVWDRSFDVAYTARSGFIAPLNAGVIFLRVSDRTRAFMARWVELNAEIQIAPKRRPVRRCGGVNQASLTALLEEIDAMGLQVHRLACREWNCEDSAWADFDPAVTRILHIKSELRRACLMPVAVRDPVHEPLIALWRRLEADARQESRTA